MGDLDRIKDFLVDLKTDLQDYVDKYDFLVPFQPDMKFYFVNAWDEVKITFDQQIMRDDEKLLFRLQETGLTGKQFDLKLRLIEKTRIEYYVIVNEYSSLVRAYQQEQNNDRKSALEKLLKILRQMAIGAKKALLISNDIPLSSLIQAIPLFGDSIAEFKDAAISTLEDT